MKKLSGFLFALGGILATSAASAAYTAPPARSVPSCQLHHRG